MAGCLSGLEQWRDGVMEYWDSTKLHSAATFQHSSTPIKRFIDRKILDCTLVGRESHMGRGW